MIGVARRMGITADLEPNLALALGSSEVPMLEMAQVYATIASGGHAIKSYGITKVYSEKSNKVLYKFEPEPAPQVFRSSDIQILVNMMMSVIQNGTGQAARSAYFVAGKTGTSQDYRDAWFDGFTNDYISVVWFGNDDNTSMKSVTGGSLPARVWRDIISAAKSDPTPSKYKLVKSYDVTSEFGDLLGRLVSEPSLLMHPSLRAAMTFLPNQDHPQILTTMIMSDMADLTIEPKIYAGAKKSSASVG